MSMASGNSRQYRCYKSNVKRQDYNEDYFLPYTRTVAI